MEIWALIVGAKKYSFLKLKPVYFNRPFFLRIKKHVYRINLKLADCLFNWPLYRKASTAEYSDGCGLKSSSPKF